MNYLQIKEKCIRNLVTMMEQKRDEKENDK